jgi:hypothetical protein
MAFLVISNKHFFEVAIPLLTSIASFKVALFSTFQCISLKKECGKCFWK